MRRHLPALALVALLALAGCSGSGADTSTEEMAPASSDGGGSNEGESDGAAEDSVGVVGADQALVDADRQVIVTGTVSIQVEDPPAAAQDVAELVEAVGGYVQERVEQTARQHSEASAYLVVRIPAAQVSTTLEQLGRLGTVIDTSLVSTEVTAQARDLDARIRALQISIGRLEELLGRAGTIADIVAAEQVLTDRQSELESLQSQRASLADQVQMSTLRLDLWTEAAVPAVPPTGFLAGLETGWKALVSTVVATLTVLGVLVPWLLVAAAVVGLVLLGRRLWTRNRPAPAPVAGGFASTGAPQAVPPGAVPTSATPAGSPPPGGPTTTLPVAPAAPVAPPAPPGAAPAGAPAPPAAPAPAAPAGPDIDGRPREDA